MPPGHPLYDTKATQQKSNSIPVITGHAIEQLEDLWAE